MRHKAFYLWQIYVMNDVNYSWRHLLNQTFHHVTFHSLPKLYFGIIHTKHTLNIPKKEKTRKRKRWDQLTLWQFSIHLSANSFCPVAEQGSARSSGRLRLSQARTSSTACAALSSAERRPASIEAVIWWILQMLRVGINEQWLTMSSSQLDAINVKTSSVALACTIIVPPTAEPPNSPVAGKFCAAVVLLFV